MKTQTMTLDTTKTPDLLKAIAESIQDKITKAEKKGWESQSVAKAYKIAAEQIGLDIADALNEGNFDRSRFLNACGII